MQELRYVTSEDGYLVFENSDEERFKVEITDALREGSRQLISSNNSTPASPKQIQVLYRAGKSEEQIAAETGESLEFIQMFTPAVQSELDYVTERVQGTEFVFGNRMMTFADIVEMSFSNPTWNSYKAGNTWFVKIRQADSEALWKYDPKLSLLEPHSEIARKISAGMQDAKSVEIATSQSSKTQPKSSATLVSADEVGEIFESQSAEGKDAEVFSLLDEIRERRLSTEKSFEPVRPMEPAVLEKKPVPAPKPATTRGRTSLPSWDEIVFGSNSDN